MREYLVRDLKLPDRKIVLIYNPVDIQRIRQLSQEQVDDPWLRDQDKHVVLWVGRIAAIKGLQYLICAFESVLKQVDARLIIVGEGSEQNAIENLVNPERSAGKSSICGFPE